MNVSTLARALFVSIVIAASAACSMDQGVTDGAASSDEALTTHVNGFAHPGILVDAKQLAFVKAHLAEDPWKSAYAKVLISLPAKEDDKQPLGFASKDYVAHAQAVVHCDSFDFIPKTKDVEIECPLQIDDAIAAYTHALLWVLTGDQAYANTSIAIVNAWSQKLTNIEGPNAPLQTAWFAEEITRAAEILRYTHSGFSAADATRFGNMLTKVLLPLIENGEPQANGNWELAMADAVIDIGVYESDRAIFDKGLALWRGRVPAYIFMTGDTRSGLPIAPLDAGIKTTADLEKYWHYETKFVDGLSQETCRDFLHTQLGLSAMTNAAETARIQGVDLYAERRDRIVAAYELHAKYLSDPKGETPPAWLCPKTRAANGGLNLYLLPMWEIGYNHYANREKIAMPYTEKLIALHRPTGQYDQMAWETLTHAETGDAGDP